MQALMNRVRVMRSRRKAGFTLLELMSVMLIMFMMMGMATISLRGVIRGSGFAGAVNNVRGVLTQARQYAIMRGIRVQVVFNETSMRIQRADNNTDVAEVRFLPAGIELDPVPSPVEFNADGTPGNTAGYSITIAEQYTENAQEHTVEIDGLTGWIE